MLQLRIDRFKRENWNRTRPTTPLLGLYLTDVDTFSLEILAAMMSGVFTLSDLPDGISFPKMLRTTAKADLAI